MTGSKGDTGEKVNFNRSNFLRKLSKTRSNRDAIYPGRERRERRGMHWCSSVVLWLVFECCSMASVRVLFYSSA